MAPYPLEVHAYARHVTIYVRQLNNTNGQGDEDLAAAQSVTFTTVKDWIITHPWVRLYVIIIESVDK